jgi:uncharacterized protein YkwD
MGVQTAKRTGKGGAIAAFVVLGIIGLGIWAAIFYKPAIDSNPTVIDTNVIVNQIHVLINTERQAMGLAPLTYDNQLEMIAQAHSESMSTLNFYDHIAPNGDTPRDRYSDAGYACSSIGENLNQAVVGSDIPSYVVNTWMNSAEHRENILRGSYDREGIGIALSADGNRVYVTQNFC